MVEDLLWLFHWHDGFVFAAAHETGSCRQELYDRAIEKAEKAEGGTGHAHVLVTLPTIRHLG